VSTDYTRILDIASAILGFEPVSDPNRADTRVARLLGASVVTVLEETITQYDFADARLRLLPVPTTLAGPAGLPAPMTVACALPDTYLGMADSGMAGHAWAVEWLNNGGIEQRFLLSEFPPGWIVIKRLPPPAQMRPLLAKAAGAALAERCALQLVESGERRNQMLTRAQLALQEAVAAETFERSAEVDMAPTWGDAMWGSGPDPWGR
jgi:hypothetical protein